MRKPIRAVGIVIKDNNILLMWRKNNGREYFTFPGGGVEDEESVEETVVRELLEETSIKVKINKLLYTHHLIEDSDQYFYLCSYVSGEPRVSQTSREKKTMDGSLDLYNSLWVNFGEIDRLLLYPLEIKDWLIEDLKDNFKQIPREASLYRKDLRQTI